VIRIASIVLALAASSASAQLIANGNNPGTAGALQATSAGTLLTNWDVQNANTTSYELRAPGLTYAGLATSGNAAFGGGSFLSAGFGLNIPESWQSANPWVPYRTSGTPNAGLDGTTLWGSMLVNNLIESPDFRVSLHSSNIRWLEESTSFRLRVSNGFWAMQQGDSGPIVTTSVKVDPGKTELMVFKYDFASTGDTVTLFANPAPGQAAPSVAGTVYNAASNLQFRSVRFNPSNTRRSGVIDEVRFGSTFASVVPADPAATGASYKRMRSYFIGNSVTDTINQDSLRISAIEEGAVVPWGRQMIPGTPLDNIISNPTGGFTNAPYGGYATALPNYEWDFVSLQPFDRGLASDRTSVNTLINLAQTNPLNSDTQFAIYSRWPRKTTGVTFEYQTLWDRPYNAANPAGSQPEESRAYFEQLRDAVQSDQPDMQRTLIIVPVGDVMYELDKRLRANPLTTTNGLFDDVGDFYSDGIHLYNSWGSYLVGATYYATMFKDNPDNFSAAPYEQIATYTAIDPQLLALIRDTVWDVVSVHPHAGVVPEPTSLALICSAGLLTLRRRR
jgi:hypothetical protein